MQRLIALLVALALLFAAPALAATPTQMAFQGLLSDTQGAPLSGTHSLTFTLYDAATAGNAVWTDTQSLAVVQGAFSTMLGGEANPLDATIFAGGALWLGVKVDDGAELSPRSPIGAVPYATHAAFADNALTTEQVQSLIDAGHYLTTESDPSVNALGKANLSCALNTVPVLADNGWTCTTITAAMLADGACIADVLAHDGAESGLDADLLDGQHGAYYLDAANLNAGTLDNARFSAYDNLSAAGYLGMAKGGDLLTLDQGDGRYAAYADLGGEISRAMSAEGNLSGRITGEYERAFGAESALQMSLNNERLQARAAESALTDSLSEEVSRATNAESDLWEALNAEKTHTHDDRYYTELEADAQFAAIDHNHDARYAPITSVPPIAQVPRGNTITTLDSEGRMGLQGSITIGADGLPIISYNDNTTYDLKVAHCSDAACTASTLVVVDSEGHVGFLTSITIGADGLPIISYYDITNSYLKVAHCSDTACLAGTLTVVDHVGTPGNTTGYSSITIGADGLPVIAYRDITNTDLKVAHCNNAACTTSTLTTVDSGSGTGYNISIVIGTDGLPIISYRDNTNGDLKVAHCSDAACTASTLTTVDSAGDVGMHTSITIGADGLPIISYNDYTNRDLKVAHCSNAACTASILTTVDSVGDVGLYGSITIGADGLPIISYADSSNIGLKVAHCSDAACTTSTLTTVESGVSVGYLASITIGADGLPVISYYDSGNYDLKVAKCANLYCVPYWKRR